MNLEACLPAILSDLRGLVAGTRADQLGDPTTCEDWKVRDLLNHVIGGGHLFAGAFAGQPAPDLSGGVPDFVGTDHVAAFDAAIAAFDSARRLPGALDGTVSLPFGELPAVVALNLAGSDLLVHSWDLARSTGQAYEPSAEVVAAGEAFYRAMGEETLRAPGVMHQATAAPTGASPIERLAAFAGRTVS